MTSSLPSGLHTQDATTLTGGFAAARLRAYNAAFASFPRLPRAPRPDVTNAAPIAA